MAASVQGKTTTVVFVHGGVGSPAELAPTPPYPEVEGHRVINVDLHSESRDATLDDDAVIEAMTGTSGCHVIVTHSAGGATIPLVAARAPVDRMDLAAAFVPRADRARTRGRPAGCAGRRY